MKEFFSLLWARYYCYRLLLQSNKLYEAKQFINCNENANIYSSAIWNFLTLNIWYWVTLCNLLYISLSLITPRLV